MTSICDIARDLKQRFGAGEAKNANGRGCDCGYRWGVFVNRRHPERLIALASASAAAAGCSAAAAIRRRTARAGGPPFRLLIRSKHGEC